MHAIASRTLVYWIDPSPLGPVGNRGAIEHRCTHCRQTVPTDQLLAHAQAHATLTTPEIPRQRHVSQANPQAARPNPSDHWR
jgi:hypothetical protein